jgi:glycosyltransferase involved in cell wall biosynthesis
MAAYNSASTIAESIASVRLQTLDDWELLVVDDGSSDETVGVVESTSDDRIRVISQTNGGPSAARNTGLRAARGRFVSTLDSDDLWLPEYMERMVGLLERTPDADIAYIDAWTLDDQTGRIRKTSAMAYQRPPVPPPVSPAEFFDVLLARNFVYNSVTMRRALVDSVGGYDERLHGAEDWELWLRTALAGHRFVRADGRLAIYRQHQDSISRETDRMLSGALLAYELVENEWDVPPETKARVTAYTAEHRRLAVRNSRGLPLRDPLTVPRLLKRALERKTLWYATPPREVADALEAISELVARDT